MKTKDRCGKPPNEAGILLKTKEIHEDAGMLLKRNEVIGRGKKAGTVQSDKLSPLLSALRYP
jgi:hypothetical protein